jgi:hypothetical protein
VSYNSLYAVTFREQQFNNWIRLRRNSRLKMPPNSLPGGRGNPLPQTLAELLQFGSEDLFLPHRRAILRLIQSGTWRVMIRL